MAPSVTTSGARSPSVARRAASWASGAAAVGPQVLAAGRPAGRAPQRGGQRRGQRGERAAASPGSPSAALRNQPCRMAPRVAAATEARRDRSDRPRRRSARPGRRGGSGRRGDQRGTRATTAARASRRRPAAESRRDRRWRGVACRGIHRGGQRRRSSARPARASRLGSGDRHDRHSQPRAARAPGDVQDRSAGRRRAIGKAVDRQAADHEQVGPGGDGGHRSIIGHDDSSSTSCTRVPPTC